MEKRRKATEKRRTALGSLTVRSFPSCSSRNDFFVPRDDRTRGINNNYIATAHRGVEKCPIETERRHDRSSFDSAPLFPLGRSFVNIKGERSRSINSIINVRELWLHEYPRDTLLWSCNPTLHAASCVIQPVNLSPSPVLPDYERTHNDNRFLLLLFLLFCPFPRFVSFSARILLSAMGPNELARNELSNSALKHRFTSLHVPHDPRNVDRGGVNGEIYLSPGNPAG